MDTSRNLVICLDGTKNEPETGATNVARIYSIAAKNSEQLVYYDPGVGTMGARGAITGIGKFGTRVAGLVVGYGIRDNIADAYSYLMHNYQAGDRIFVFGFSRGAYTARALTGMLRTVGLLNPGADNLIPYALKLYAKHGGDNPTPAQDTEFWDTRRDFSDNFGNPAFERFAKNIEFLGVWDTVKSVGGLNWRAQFEQAQWPFTRKTPNVVRVRHAIAIDENRRPYPEYRFTPDTDKSDRIREVWFAGVHSDVGGKFPEHRLSDIALKWMTDEAIEAGLQFDEERYADEIGVAHGSELVTDHLKAEVHENSLGWALVTFGWHRRKINTGDEVHPSVAARIAATANGPKPYRPRLPGNS